jgi:hypothetical protein
VSEYIPSSSKFNRLIQWLSFFDSDKADAEKKRMQHTGLFTHNQQIQLISIG